MQKVIAALPSLMLALAFAGIAFFLVDPVLGGDLSLLSHWLLAAGLVTFVYYGFDKARSKGKGRRIPEWTLHGLALAGGVVGGWLGMFLFKHKTNSKHREFRLILLLASLLWVWIFWQQI